MPNYNICDVKAGRKLVPVNGKAIVLDGFEQFYFFKHETYEKDRCGVLNTEIISISECSTGGLIAEATDIDACIKKALKNLQGVGAKKFKKMIEDQVKKTGKPANSINNS